MILTRIQHLHVTGLQLPESKGNLYFSMVISAEHALSNLGQVVKAVIGIV